MRKFLYAAPGNAPQPQGGPPQPVVPEGQSVLDIMGEPQTLYLRIFAILALESVPVVYDTLSPTAIVVRGTSCAACGLARRWVHGGI
jgi:hypothetical protein